jgi:RNAse (barnase) inhibitor barstar
MPRDFGAVRDWHGRRREPTMKTLTIAGHDIVDIPSFYAEMNRVFMAGEDWRLAQSLDALNDMFYGGYGAISGREPVRIMWQGFEHTRLALGRTATRDFLAEKLKRPDVFNIAQIGSQLAALDQGAGQTYFDIVIEIIADHGNIELVPAD